MNFQLPGRIVLSNFANELRPLVEMLSNNGLSMVTDVQISLRGFSEQSEYYLVSPAGLPIAVTFERHFSKLHRDESGFEMRTPLEIFQLTDTAPEVPRKRGLAALLGDH